jgi:hypothetical protein
VLRNVNSEGLLSFLLRARLMLILAGILRWLRLEQFSVVRAISIVGGRLTQWLDDAMI